MPDRPLIVVANDDGITAHGIRHLVECMQQLGDVMVVAPNSPQSGMGHAITINDPLKVYRSDIFGDIDAYECSGTPADCIKLAKNYLLKDREPDLPAIGFSLCDYSRDSDFSHILEHVTHITKQALKNGIPKGVALNVNFPKRSEETIKGIKICRQAIARWQEEFDERVDPYGRKYLWLSGHFINDDKGEDTDEWAIKNNYVSVVPVSYDMTAHHNIATINSEWDLE